jgi:hypothetical protein
MSGTLHYPDIYSGDAGINFSSSYIVVAKATQGTTYKNPEYAAFKSQAAANNVFFVAYHFLEKGNGKGQAQACAAMIGKGTPLMVDAEPDPQANNTGPSVQDVADFVNECWNLGVPCWLVYFPKWYWQELGQPSLKPIVGNPARRLVTSDYTTYSDNGPGWAGYGGMEVAAWQYSATVAYGGKADVDFNAFKGSGSANTATTLAEFKAFVTTGKWPGSSPVANGPAPTPHFSIAKLPPGQWEGMITLSGKGSDGQVWHTTSDDGRTWSTPKKS